MFSGHTLLILGELFKKLKIFIYLYLHGILKRTRNNNLKDNIHQVTFQIHKKNNKNTLLLLLLNESVEPTQINLFLQV